MDDETRDRLQALEARIRRLETTSVVLSKLLGKSDVDASVRRRLRGTEPVEIDDDDSAEQENAGVGGVRGSVYRGGSAGASSGLVCGVCRRPIDPEDPEIMLGDVGRVCLLCSQRAR